MKALEKGERGCKSYIVMFTMGTWGGMSMLHGFQKPLGKFMCLVLPLTSHLNSHLYYCNTLVLNTM